MRGGAEVGARQGKARTVVPCWLFAVVLWFGNSFARAWRNDAEGSALCSARGSYTVTQRLFHATWGRSMRVRGRPAPLQRASNKEAANRRLRRASGALRAAARPRVGDPRGAHPAHPATRQGGGAGAAQARNRLVGLLQGSSPALLLQQPGAPPRARHARGGAPEAAPAAAGTLPLARGWLALAGGPRARGRSRQKAALNNATLDSTLDFSEDTSKIFFFLRKVPSTRPSPKVRPAGGGWVVLAL